MGLILGRGIKSGEINGRHLLFFGNDNVTNSILFKDGNGTTKRIFDFVFDSADGSTKAYLSQPLVTYQPITYSSDPVNDNELARKAYVDSKIGGVVSGTTWLEPVIARADSPDSNSGRYIVGDNPTGDFASFNAGDIVEYSNDSNSWVLVKAVGDLVNGTAIYPTKAGLENKFYTYTSTWLEHNFEATTVEPSSVLKLTGLELSLKPTNNGEILIGQGSTAQPSYYPLGGDANLNETGLLTIVNEAITANKIADNAIVSTKISAGAVIEGSIADNAVSEQKLSADVQTKLNSSIQGDGWSTWLAQDNSYITSTTQVSKQYTVTSTDVSNKYAIISGSNYAAEEAMMELYVFGARFTKHDGLVFTVTNNASNTGDGSHDIKVDWSNCPELSDTNTGIQDGDELELSRFLYETYN